MLDIQTPNLLEAWIQESQDLMLIPMLSFGDEVEPKD